MVTRQEARQMCDHLDQMAQVTPDSLDSCPECVAQGDAWVHLRECQTCGHVGCCDSSRNKHATAHYAASGHPVVRSYEPGESWWWCYDDAVAFELDDVGPLRTA